MLRKTESLPKNPPVRFRPISAFRRHQTPSAKPSFGGQRDGCPDKLFSGPNFYGNFWRMKPHHSG